MRAAAVAHRPLLLVLEPRLGFGAAVSPLAAVDDDGHVRVVLVVVDHLVVELVVQIQTPQGLGSGVVFDTNGDIVTNNHVVGGNGGPFTVTAGARSFGASLVGRFPPDDLAVVRVSGAQLTPAAFADSSQLEVGN